MVIDFVVCWVLAFPITPLFFRLAAVGSGVLNYVSGRHEDNFGFASSVTF